MKATTKLQKAGRAFLLSLLAEHGPQGAARILRSLAEELEALWRTQDGEGGEVRPQSLEK